MSRSRFSCAVRVTVSLEVPAAGARRLCHCERLATPVGSIMASSIAMVPLILNWKEMMLNAQLGFGVVEVMLLVLLASEDEEIFGFGLDFHRTMFRNLEAPEKS